LWGHPFNIVIIRNLKRISNILEFRAHIDCNSKSWHDEKNAEIITTWALPSNAKNREFTSQNARD
jgi:hypothetical protein